VVAGLKSDFDKNFKNLSVISSHRHAPFTRAFLSFSTKSAITTIQVKGCTARFRSFYKDFEHGFNAFVPISFTTKLLSYRTADEISVCVWQVSSSKNRQTISPVVEWP
jgi:hypothetical protein